MYRGLETRCASQAPAAAVSDIVVVVVATHWVSWWWCWWWLDTLRWWLHLGHMMVVKVVTWSIYLDSDVSIVVVVMMVVVVVTVRCYGDSGGHMHSLL